MINLLPPSYKQELRRIKKRRVILAWEVVFSFFLLSFALELLAVYFYLQGEYRFQKALADNLEFELSKSQKAELKQQALKLNNDLAFINSRQDTKKLSGALEALSKMLGPGFKVELISYDRNAKSISLSGQVETREQLLFLKSALEAESFFSDVDFPPSNWVKSRDINFFFKAKIL